jgi:hypothetical protein
LLDIGQIGVAVASTRRSSHSNKNGIGVSHSLAKLGSEGQTTSLHVGSNQILEAWLKDWHNALMESLNFAYVFIDADDLMAEIREAGARNQSYIPRADHCDAHD